MPRRTWTPGRWLRTRTRWAGGCDGGGGDAGEEMLELVVATGRRAAEPTEEPT